MILTAPASGQVFTGVPATATVAGRIVSVFVEVVLPHPAFDAVNVIVTLPAAISAALGE